MAVAATPAGSRPTRAGGVALPWARRQIRPWAALLAGLFALTRLLNLTLAGLNYDEPTYLYWGQVIGADWSQRYIGAGWGGKQPLHAWLVALSELFLPDPVFAGRLISVVAGALALTALWLLARRLFSPRTAVLAGLLYILCPFTLLFDRQALIDSLLVAEALWTIYLSVRLVDRQQWTHIAGLALTFGAALLTKSVSGAFPLLLPASLLAAQPGQVDRRSARRWLAAVLGALAAGWLLYYLAFGRSQAAALIPRFEQQYGRYSMSLAELLALPWQTWRGNAASVVHWFGSLMTLPLAVAAVAALLASPRLGRKVWLLAAWVVLPVAGQVAVAARFYERYILFSIPPLLLLAARFLEWAYERLAETSLGQRRLGPYGLGAVVATVLLAGLLALPTVQSLTLLVDEEAVNRATGAFDGLAGMRNYIAERARIGDVAVVADYSPAPIPDGAAVLLHRTPGVTVLRVAPSEGRLVIFDPATQQLYPKEQLAGKEVYYAHQEDAEQNSWLANRLELVRSFPNHRGDDSFVGLYGIRFDDSFR